MLTRVSRRTLTLLKRQKLLFIPLWWGLLGYFLFRHVLGFVPHEWDRLFFAVFELLFAISFVHGVVTFLSARKDASKSQHPDPNAAALIDGEIDIAEYGRRRAVEADSASHGAASQER
jgi:hypothetical protein